MPNLNPEQVNLAKTQLESARNILVALPSESRTDNIAAALALYLSLSAAGKQVSLVSPTEMTVNFNHLIGVDKISTTFSATGGKNLIISFPYEEGSIEKVSYNIENNTFNLVIEPREGYPSITPEMMRYSSGNGNYDCVIAIGSANPEELGQIYSNNRNLFTEKPVINIDDDSANSNFGKINLVDPASSSISEIVLSLMDQIGLTIEADMATNLLAGLTSATDNFASVQTTAGTFENAALLLKYGAKKMPIRESRPTPAPQFTRPDYRQEINPQKSPSLFGKTSRTPFSRPASTPATPQSFYKPKIQPQQRPFMRQGQGQQSPQQMQQQPLQQQLQKPSTNESGKPPETPPDWLKPKIYKGSTLL